MHPQPCAIVWSLLDSAIADVATREYDRLTKDKSPSDQAEFVDRALEQLHLLQHGRGQRPRYDVDGVALFYLTWYQPRQIILAYSALRHAVGAQKLPSCVVDYGCGAFAGQIALAVLLTMTPDCPPVALHGFDSSSAMRQTGGRAWATFRSLLATANIKGADQSLRQALSSLNEFCHFSYESYDKHFASRHDNSWFTAFHAVYEQNRTDLLKVFELMRQKHHCALGLVTFNADTHANNDTRSLLSIHGFEHFELVMHGPRNNGLERTTKWRRELSSRLDGYLSSPSLRDLKRNVEWVRSSVNDAGMLWTEDKR